MQHIGVTFRDDTRINLLHAAFPGSEIHAIDISTAARVAARYPLGALLLGEAGLEGTGPARIAVLKTRHPALAVVAYLTVHSVPLTLGLARARVDAALITQGVEDHEQAVRQTLGNAAQHSVATVIERLWSPGPAWLVASNVSGVVRKLDQLRFAGALAATLEVEAHTARKDLTQHRLPSLRRLLTHIRVLAACRTLQDSKLDVLRVAGGVGYRSSIAMANAFHALLGTTPTDVREHGGLWFAYERLRAGVAAFRPPPPRIFPHANVTDSVRRCDWIDRTMAA